MHANIDQTTPRMVQAVAAVSRLAQQDHVLRSGCTHVAWTIWWHLGGDLKGLLA